MRSGWIFEVFNMLGLSEGTVEIWAQTEDEATKILNTMEFEYPISNIVFLEHIFPSLW